MRANYKEPAPRRLVKPSPKRQAEKPNRAKKNPLLTIGKVLYCILVAISAVIVVGYLAFTLFVPEPEIVQPDPLPETPVVTPVTP